MDLDNANLNDSSSYKPIDIGFLAEAMLFYEKVHIVVNHAMFKSIIEHCPPDILLECVDSEILTISYSENLIGIHTQTRGNPLEFYRPAFIRAPDYSWSEYAPKAFSEVGKLSMKGAKRLAKRFRRIKPVFLENSIVTEVLEDFTNGRYIEEAITLLIERIVPEYQFSEKLIFEIYQNGDFWVVETNLDFKIQQYSNLKLMTFWQDVLEVRMKSATFKTSFLMMRPRYEKLSKAANAVSGIFGKCILLRIELNLESG